MKKLENLRENLCGELEKVAKKTEINMQDLDVIDKLTHSIKNLDKVMLGNEMIEEYGYSNNYSGARRGRDGDSDGRYNEGRGRSRDSRSYDSYNRGDSSYERDGRSYNDRSYDRDYSRERGYSGHDTEIDRFKMMMQDAVNRM